MNVVAMPRAIINAPFGPRENTPELRAALRKASVKDVRARLADHSRVSVKTWVMIGRELLDEKRRAQDDGPKVFKALFAITSGDRRDTTRYPFSLNTAYQLIAVAESEFFTSGKNSDHLPSSWRTLYVLSHIPAPRISKLIESGAVHPLMTRAEASRLTGAKPARPKAVDAGGYGLAKQHLLTIKAPNERVAVFIKLMRDCNITLKQLQGAV